MSADDRNMKNIRNFVMDVIVKHCTILVVYRFFYQIWIFMQTKHLN